MLLTLVRHYDLLYKSCGAVGCPLVADCSVLEAYRHCGSKRGYVAIEPLELIVGKSLLPREEQLVPEERLQRVERDAVVGKETYLLV